MTPSLSEYFISAFAIMGKIVSIVNKLNKDNRGFILFYSILIGMRAIQGRVGVLVKAKRLSTWLFAVLAGLHYKNS